MGGERSLGMVQMGVDECNQDTECTKKELYQLGAAWLRGSFQSACLWDCGIVCVRAFFCAIL